MLNKFLPAIKSALLILAVAVNFAVVASPSAYAAEPIDEACEGISAVTGKSCDPANNTLGDTIASAINLFSFVIGVAAVVAIMYGGYRYITAAGDATKVNTAKNTILYALVGVVIAALSQVIVQFVLTRTDA